MLQVEISEADIQEAKYERFHHFSPIVQKRMSVISCKSIGLAHWLIAEISGLHPNSVTNTLKIYQEEGFEGLRKLDFKKPESDLMAFKTSLETDFKDNPPLSVTEGIDRIKKLTGISRKPTQVRNFMKKIGMGFRKMGHIPAKADHEEQELFKKKSLDPLIRMARNGYIHLFFVDAAHFVLAPFLCPIWCFARIFIKAPAGRNRYNVLGALHATTLMLTTITNTDYITSNTIIELLKKLVVEYKDRPIYLVLDNARYQRCKLVEEMAKKLGIELVFLPPYSPNLNIIERLWKWTKKKSLYGKYYDTFDKFMKGIDQALHNCNHDPESKNELKTLLTLKFQTFINSQNLAA